MSRHYLQTDLIEAFVKPFYGELVHGSIGRQRKDLQIGFAERAARVLPSVNDRVLEGLRSGGWRENLVASWFIGLLKRDDLADDIGGDFVASRQCFAGQMHSFALVRIGSARAVGFLEEYLHVWLRRPECTYDQAWALAALIVAAERNGTDRATEFLRPGGLWETFRLGAKGTYDLNRIVETLRSLLDLAEEVDRMRASPLGAAEGARSVIGVPLREEPRAAIKVVMWLQRGLVRVLYRAGLTSKSPYFPVLLRIGRARPLGYYSISYHDWCQRFLGEHNR